MIKIIAVGKLKEKYFIDASAEYLKRLNAYTKIEVVGINEEKSDENISEKQAETIREHEAALISKHIKKGEYVIALDIGGEKMSSEEFAAFIERKATSGISDLDFVIGGSTGLSKEFIKKADYRLSFSDMTFPHHLMRIILLEQIFRAYKIIKNEPYHK